MSLQKNHGEYPWRLSFWSYIALTVALTVVILGIISDTFGSQNEIVNPDRAARKPPIGSPSWVKTPPPFPGKVLHWRQISYTYAPGSPDPANGKEVLGDIWEQIGTDGTLKVFHGRYTYMDGTFYQEIFENATTTITIEGKVYAALESRMPQKRWCIDQESTQKDTLVYLLPPFIRESLLAKNGYHLLDGIPTKALPPTPPLEQATPLAVYSFKGSAHIWTLRNLVPGNIFLTRRIEVDSQSRLLVEDSAFANTSGTILRENWDAKGSLYIYDDASVPASAVRMPQHLQGGCNQ